MDVGRDLMTRGLHATIATNQRVVKRRPFSHPALKFSKQGGEIVHLTCSLKLDSDVEYIWVRRILRGSS
jgi:hypothetical protein